MVAEIKQEHGTTDLLEIDLSIGTHPGFSDQVDDPLLAFIARQVQTIREVTVVIQGTVNGGTEKGRGSTYPISMR